MEIVEFEDEQNSEDFHIRSPKINLFGTPETPTMIRLLLKTKLVKSEKQAFVVLLSTIALSGIAILCIFYIRNRESPILDRNGNPITVQEYVDTVKGSLKRF